MMDHATRFAASARNWASSLMLGVNLAVAAVLGSFFIIRGAHAMPPWDRPAVATLARTVATMVLASVDVGIGQGDRIWPLRRRAQQAQIR